LIKHCLLGGDQRIDAKFPHHRILRPDAEDIGKLLTVLSRLVDQGNTVLVIEHNLDVVKTADWIIDLGPEGGARGGRILAAGSPEQVAQVDESYTGVHLRQLLARRLKKAG
jgi:excinuclease ABC subunit A